MAWYDNIGNPSDTVGILQPNELEDLMGNVPHPEDQPSYWNGGTDEELNEAPASTPYRSGYQPDFAAARKYAFAVNPFAFPGKRAELMQNYIDKDYQQWLLSNQTQLQMEDLKAAGINPYYLFSGGSMSSASPVSSNVSGSSGSGAAKLLALLGLLARLGMAASGHPGAAAAAGALSRIPSYMTSRR